MSIIYQPSVTTHWRNLFESKSMLLGSHNLNEGEELVCEIQSTSIEVIKNKNGKDERVPVLCFNNAPPMVLNITNTKGPFWVNRKVPKSPLRGQSRQSGNDYRNCQVSR